MTNFLHAGLASVRKKAFTYERMRCSQGSFLPIIAKGSSTFFFEEPYRSNFLATPHSIHSQTGCFLRFSVLETEMHSSIRPCCHLIGSVPSALLLHKDDQLIVVFDLIKHGMLGDFIF